jgi:hypothetical protein
MSKKTGSILKLMTNRFSWFSAIVLLVIGLVTTAAAAVTFALAPSSTRNSQTEEKKVELIKIRSTGITPTEITRAAGVCAFTIDNESGVQEITLYLDRADGVRVSEIAIPSGVPNWGAEVNLTVGSYTLREANHPQWSCRIIVREK